MKINFWKGIIFTLLLCQSIVLVAQNKPEVKLNPRLYLTQEDVKRAQLQQNNPQLKPSFDKMKVDLDRVMKRWKLIVPTKQSDYSMEELFELAKASKTRPEYVLPSVAMVFFPSDEIAKILREMLLYEVGIHQNEGSWRELGIHESERLHRFLFAYDLAGKDLLAEKEKAAVKKEVNQSGRFLEAWCLESRLNSIYQGETFCFNINYFPISMLGTIAMYYPDLEESEAWLAKAQEEVPRYFLTENFLDGAYGENSMNYWSCAGDAIVGFMQVSRNLGVKDYTKDLPLRKALVNYMYWRANLTAPDGRKTAIGDAHHENDGNKHIEQAAMLLNDPQLVWVSRNSTRLANNGIWEPDELMFLNLSLPSRKPENRYANYIWSGYGVYRSGWGDLDNYFMMKYGPTFAGRREIEKYPVVAGHAHADCMEIEMFYNGIPMFIDPGFRGVYRDYDIYGGYWKATVAHNTVGIGNKYGYNRTDGKFEEHRKKHGKEFRYEEEQLNIGRQTYRMMAWGDVNSAVLLSSKAETYKNVEHQRSVLWFRNSSLMLVHDKMTSETERPYEWYLNPIGSNLSSGNNYTFGDESAKMDVVQIGNKPTQVIGKGTPGIPRYYYAFRDEFKAEDKVDGPNARWSKFSLLTESVKAKNAEFFNILIPYKGSNPYKVSDLGSNGKLLASPEENILVSGKCREKQLTVDGWFGMVRSTKELNEYALSNGYELRKDGELLLSSTLQSVQWKDLYDHAVTGIVSIENKRASFTLNPDPWNEYMLMNNPKLVEGEEPAVPVRVKISFKVDKKPIRIVKFRSNEEQAELNDPVFSDKVMKGNFFTGKKQYKNIEAKFAREELKFEYDEKSKLVTIILPNGFNQLVWE